MQENFVNIFHKFDFERQKMAEEKQGGKIITPLGWENNSQNLKVDLTQRSNKKADLSAKRGVLSWVEFQQSDEFKAIKRQKMPNGKWQFVPNNEQLRKLVLYEEISLGEIDTSEVTDMSFLFRKKRDFSGIGSWDTSKVTTFERMFYRADNFNEDISKWDTSKAISFKEMFYGASNFNQPLNSWNTSRVTDMSGMFDGANEFNEDISGWDTSRVTNMSSMFRGAENFNQPLDRWDTSSVTNMCCMFLEAGNFNQPLNSWDISKVTDMSSMFRGAKSLICDFFSWWETSEVCDLKDRIKDSGVEKLRDARKKIKNEIGHITKEQRVELAQILGLDEKELKIINEPALSNFDIYKVIINEEDFLKSILPYEGEGEKVVKNWLVKDVAYRVYLLRYDKENDEFI